LDNRKSDRKPVRENTYAFFTNKTSPVAGCIVDISDGGMSFQYFSPNNQNLSKNNSDLTLFTEGGEFVKGIQVSPVYDYPLSSVLPFISTSYMRRCGLKFKELTPEKKKRLLVFFEEQLSERINSSEGINISEDTVT
jgi:c-di-GMP-binding flagellar brake protein YcgR